MIEDMQELKMAYQRGGLTPAEYRKNLAFIAAKRRLEKKLRITGYHICDCRAKDPRQGI